MPGMDRLVVRAPQHLEGGHAYEEQASWLEHTDDLAHGHAVVLAPRWVEHVERRHGVEARVRERQGEEAAPGGRDAAAPAEAQGFVREIDAHGAPEAAEVGEVVARAATSVEDAPGLRPAVRPLRGQEREADGAHARVPPLGLLGLVHAAVLLEVHRASAMGTAWTASTSACPPRANSSARSCRARTKTSRPTVPPTSVNPGASAASARSCPLR